MYSVKNSRLIDFYCFSELNFVLQKLSEVCLVLTYFVAWSQGLISSHAIVFVPIILASLRVTLVRWTQAILHLDIF